MESFLPMDPIEHSIAFDLERCRVCKTPLSKEHPGITKEFTGDLYRFCSDKCLAEFELDPEKYEHFPDENGEE